MGQIARPVIPELQAAGIGLFERQGHITDQHQRDGGRGNDDGFRPLVPGRTRPDGALIFEGGEVGRHFGRRGFAGGNE